MYPGTPSDVVIGASSHLRATDLHASAERSANQLSQIRCCSPYQHYPLASRNAGRYTMSTAPAYLRQRRRRTGAHTRAVFVTTLAWPRSRRAHLAFATRPVQRAPTIWVPFRVGSQISATMLGMGMGTTGTRRPHRQERHARKAMVEAAGAGMDKPLFLRSVMHAQLILTACP